MDHFSYIDGHLHAENIAMSVLAERVGTPCFVYSARTLLDHYDRLLKAFSPLDPLICYSIKSCSNLSICRLLARHGTGGAGMDLVSGGELRRAQLSGVNPAKCVYAGVGKTDPEIAAAIKAGVGWLNVESEEEFENISVIAASLGKTCRVALRINPDVDPRTHRFTTTGKKETKFGVDIERAKDFFKSYGKDTHCRLAGIHLHIGSPVYSPEPYVRSIEKALELIDELAGKGFPIEMLDLGGGFGADYETEQSPSAADYAAKIVPLLEQRVREGLKIIIEPGRTITANAGILLLKVLYVKKSGDKTFVICDGGMNVLLRPSHYDAFHFIWPCDVSPEFVPTRREEHHAFPGAGGVNCDIVGPICETGDFLALDRTIPPVQRGDLMAVFSAGAYGMSMASRYNSMPLPAEVLVDGDAAQLIRRRETTDDLVRHEMKPTPIELTIAPSLEV